jgi:hypothetical protein
MLLAMPLNQCVAARRPAGVRKGYVPNQIALGVDGLRHSNRRAGIVAVVLAIAFAVTVGAFFSFFPARKPARTAENGFATRSDVSKSAKVVLEPGSVDY